MRHFIFSKMKKYKNFTGSVNSIFHKFSVMTGLQKEATVAVF